MVPDLVVLDQQLAMLNNQLQLQTMGPQSAPNYHQRPDTQTQAWAQQTGPKHQPQAASLVNEPLRQQQQQQQQQLNTLNHHQINFECLVSFDKKRDKNLVIKWHHDERSEPIYQWIPELNKRTIAPQYRGFIVAAAAGGGVPSGGAGLAGHSSGAPNSTGSAQDHSADGQLQVLEAGFKLVRPTRELGGEYQVEGRLDEAEIRCGQATPTRL